MGDLLGIVAALLQRSGEPGEVAGDLLGQLLPGLGRPKHLRIRECGLQPAALLGILQLLDRDRVDARDGIGPVGVDADRRADVRDDEQRRIVERDGIALQLREGGIEVRPRALVFPGEAAAPEHVGEAVAAGRPGGADLESVVAAGRIGIGRGRFVQQPAEIEEMRLRGRPLLQGRVPPLGDELARCHLAAPPDCVDRQDLADNARQANPEAAAALRMIFDDTPLHIVRR